MEIELYLIELENRKKENRLLEIRLYKDSTSFL